MPHDARDDIRPEILHAYAKALAESEAFVCEELPRIRDLRPPIKRALKQFRGQLQEAIRAADNLQNEFSVALRRRAAAPILPNPADLFLTKLNRIASDFDFIIASERGRSGQRRQLTVLTYAKWRRIEDDDSGKWQHRFELAQSWDLTTAGNPENFRRSFVRATRIRGYERFVFEEIYGALLDETLALFSLVA